jgi:hypothetical protein
MKNGGWLDKYSDGGTMQEHQENYNNASVSLPEGFVGDGYNTKGRDYSPAWGGQFQTGGYLKKKLKKTERELLKEYVDPSTKKALEKAKQQGITTGIHNGPLDAIRHSSSAAAMTSALPTWTNFIPGVAPLKMAATNVAGAAHEIGSPNSWQEHASDLYNNFIGSVVGALPIPEENQHDLLIEAQKRGVLSDMGDKTPLRKRPVTPKKEMGGSIPGAVGFSYARTEGAAPDNGPYAKKTMASAQNGMRILQPGEKFMNNNFNSNSKKATEAEKALKQILTNNKQRQKDRKFDIRETPRTVVNDAIPAPKKLHTTDLNKLNVRNKTQAEIDAEEAANDKAIAAQRKAIRENSDANVLNDWSEFFDSKNHTRQNWEDSTAGLESKFRVSDKPNFFDDWLNPLNMIGGMAADLGAAPNQIVQQDSMAPLYSAIATPLLTGMLEGFGAKSNKEFVNNLINPVNFVPGYRSVEKAVGKKLRNMPTSVAPELRQGLATQGFPNPLGMVDKIVPRPPAPLHFLGMEDSWNHYSPLNLIPGYGQKLSAASSHPRFVGFRKFGNSIQDVIESQSLRPKGTGMGSKQIMGEGNWAEPGKVNEHYSGVFEATMNPQIEGSNIRLEKWRNRNGIVGTTNEGDVAIPLTDPGLSFNRRLPFSNRYIPINKDKLINNQFQWSTQLPHLQSLTEKYGLWAGGAGAAGYFTGGSEGAKENINTFNEYTIDPLINLTKPYYNQAEKEFTRQTSQYKNGGVIKDDRGQWDHPGEVTEINSNIITMKPDPMTGKKLTRPIIGVSDTGDVKIMKPGKDYKFRGTKVTEYPMAQDGETIPGGKNIKVKYPDGDIKTVNTGSPEYIEMYKKGKIQTPEGIANDTYWGGELDDVKVSAKLSALAKARGKYDKEHGREAFINEKKDEYIKGLGESNWYGADRNNFPENVLRDINANYDYNRNTEAIERLAKQRGWDLTYRDNWVDKLTPGEREAVMNSKYSSQLNPNEFSNTLSGIQQLGNTLLPGNPLPFPIVGLTPKEEEEDRNSMLSGLKVFSLMNAPGNAAANYLKNTNTSSYPEYRSQSRFDIPFVDFQRMGNVSEVESMAFNPLTYQGVASLPTMVSGIGSKYNAAKNIFSNVKPILQDIKPLAKDLKEAYKQRGIINQQIRDLPNYLSQAENREAALNYVTQNDIVNPEQLRTAYVDILDNLRSAARNIDPDNLAHRVEMDIMNFNDNAPEVDRLRDLINSQSVIDPAEAKSLLKELSEKLPKIQDYGDDVKNILNKKKGELIINTKQSNKAKDFFKNILKNSDKKIEDLYKHPNVELSKEEERTLDAIRELGKYRRLFSTDRSEGLRNREVMENVRDLISKLDEDVVQKLMGVPKQQFIDSYRALSNVTKEAPELKGPLQYSNIQEAPYNELLESINSKVNLDPTGQRLFGTSPADNVFSKAANRYNERILPYEYETPNSKSIPELIHYAETNYALVDDINKPILDASGNIIGYEKTFVKPNTTKLQLKGAIDKVSNAVKGDELIGAHNLSTDSYSLSLRAALPYLKKGTLRVKVAPENMATNAMGTATRFPKLAIKDINSQIQEIEKVTGKKLPRASYDASTGSYNFPTIYFEKLKYGGSISSANKNSLVKLDQLTNFTNYNTKQPGGWLDKYN